VPSLAELVDAVIGIDTHRDTHEAEIADTTGTPIATLKIGNDSTGFAELLAWIAEHAPGPRLAVSLEGTRSYGVGLARTLTAAGLLVIECEQPNQKQRRGKGKSDPIDAHLAVLAALRLDANRLPALRADGDREALRILLGARQDIITASTAQTNRLRALLLCGDDTDRRSARSALTEAALAGLARRRLPVIPAATTRFGTPRSAASHSRCAKRTSSSRTTANNCWPSSMTSLPD
jgi:transposase